MGCVVEHEAGRVMDDPEEMERKVRKVQSMPLTQRDVLMDTCAVLVDLSPEALEFQEIVAIVSRETQPFDPIAVMAAAVKRYSALRKRN